MSDRSPLVFHRSSNDVDPDKLAVLVNELARASEVVAFVYQPDRFVIGKKDDTGGFKTVVEKDGKRVVESLKFTDAYEVIVFCEKWELRWVREGLSGTATLLCETAMVLDGNQAEAIGNVVDRSPISYLVWGNKGEEKDKGWTTLHNNQIGPLEIPATGAEEFCLAAMEYFVEETRHGNVAFGFQRLLGFVPREEEKTK